MVRAQKMTETIIALTLSIEERSTGYFLELIDTFALPRIFKFTDQRISCVRIPDRIGGMPIAVWKRPVTAPAAAPARKAARMQRYTFTPFDIRTARTQAPVQIEPSTVRSAMSSIL